MTALVGWRERVSLPDLGVRLVAKMDTGALSSVLHADEVEIMPGGRVRFQVPLRRDGTRWRTVEAPHTGWRWVKDSGGHGSMRPLIRTRLRLGQYTWEEDVTLYPRSGMQHRLLLGRRAMAGRFAVVPEQAFMLTARQHLMLAP